MQAYSQPSPTPTKQEIYRTIATPHPSCVGRLAWIVTALFIACIHSGMADERAEKLADLNIPGIKIHAKEGYIDIDARVALTEGALEFIACTKDTKEHESVIVVDAKPLHIHTALLLIGAEAGHPAMSKPIGEEKNRWIHLPPRGDKIHVSLVVKDKEGKQVERPISEFLEPSADPYDEYLDESEKEEKPAPFPTNEFIFAGSHLIEEEGQPKRYLAEASGHVISISTFGDEVLCLPGIHAHANEHLAWQVNDTHLPALNEKVTLRLKPVRDEDKEK